MGKHINNVLNNHVDKIGLEPILPLKCLVCPRPATFKVFAENGIIYTCNEHKNNLLDSKGYGELRS